LFEKAGVGNELVAGCFAEFGAFAFLGLDATRIASRRQGLLNRFSRIGLIGKNMSVSDATPSFGWKSRSVQAREQIRDAGFRKQLAQWFARENESAKVRGGKHAVNELHRNFRECQQIGMLIIHVSIIISRVSALSSTSTCCS
jgi:hypothetical protein